jgi:glucose dehydrogenase
MSRRPQYSIQLLTMALVAFIGLAAAANEQIAWRYDPNLKANNLLRRVACTDSENAACKQSVKTCYEDCTKVPDLGSRSACFRRCAIESLACFKACGY